MGKFILPVASRAHCRPWSSHRQVTQLLLALLLSAVFAGTHARGIHEGNFEEQEEVKKPSLEMPVSLPVFPLPENLLPFSAGPIATQSFAIDAKSLTVGPDEVRYTLVATSKAGAQNISYEGIRCLTLEMKRYAFGHKDGKWSLSPGASWVPILFHSANKPQAVLAQDYLCLQGSVSGKPEEMLDRIRYNRALPENNYKPL